MQNENDELDEDGRNAKTALTTKKDEIKKKKPKPNKEGESVITLKPNNDKDLKTIKYYNPKSLTKAVKQNFGNYLDMKQTELKESFPTSEHKDAQLGQQWDRFLSERIDGKETSGKRDAADLLFDYLKAEFGITLLKGSSHMPLYGYMYRQEKLSPRVYYWDGEADAVGWYYNTKKEQNEYVIVDWKARELLDYWNGSSALGHHLHQCLVYARLLQLHLDLSYLPSILIVPISKNNGRDIQPGFFYDYPHECKSFLDEQLTWSIEQPKPLRNIYDEFPFNPTLNVGVVSGDMLLKNLFAEEAKVKDLLEVFDWNGLKVIKKAM